MYSVLQIVLFSHLMNDCCMFGEMFETLQDAGKVFKNLNESLLKVCIGVLAVCSDEECRSFSTFIVIYLMLVSFALLLDVSFLVFIETTKQTCSLIYLFILSVHPYTHEPRPIDEPDDILFSF